MVAAPRYLTKFQNTQSALRLEKQKVANHCSLHWMTPPRGEPKLNTDAAVRPNCDSMRIGAVIRDCDGLVVAALSKPFAGVFSAELGEYLALSREGLILAKNLGPPGVLMELMLLLRWLVWLSMLLSPYTEILR
ncbi:hypothetical protein QYF36_016143 [Acer negundo]|nr:hypothetical protein QYF36_016143 [Acer negundo]